MIIKPFHPFPILETERLSLREISDEDDHDLYEILSDPEVALYDYFYPVDSIEKTHLFIRRYHSELMANDEITWGIYLKTPSKLIGTCCLGNFDQDTLRAEVGYALLQSEWRKGYGTEAVGKIVDFGFEQMALNRIEATITPGNDGSVRLLEKVNFQKEGLVRQRDLIKGQLVDGIIMGILREDRG
ncbi:GNAT family N-acetyltransferase [Fusibacter sp. 3D3]|uniref:GNAT family N-acetyltransferase n=1 Tax=Fusibacter sp. 3D3 TaxID=1048380 RepID=UPI000852C4BD|nr:GNAT family protein [Fusibacter sp. 3D3]GAU80069.1 acetyltransferase [Fusibacter sp. 3D3]